MSKEAVRRIGLQFDDNLLVPLLFGEHDCNLAQIEEELEDVEKKLNNEKEKSEFP